MTSLYKFLQSIHKMFPDVDIYLNDERINDMDIVFNPHWGYRLIRLILPVEFCLTHSHISHSVVFEGTANGNHVTIVLKEHAGATAD